MPTQRAFPTGVAAGAGTVGPHRRTVARTPRGGPGATQALLGPGEVLLRLLRREAASPAWLSPALAGAAKHHRMVLPLAAAIRAAGLDGPAVRQVEGNALARSVVAQRLTRAASDVSEWLEGAGIRHAVLKGPVVAGAYPGGVREFSDLDVLVDQASVPVALEVLRGHGIEPAPSQPAWPRDDAFGEIELVMPGIGTLELHSDLIVRADVRAAHALRMPALLDRRRRLRLPGGELPSLDVIDNLLHVALHATISGGNRLGWFADITWLVEQGGFSWEELVARAHDARISRTASRSCPCSRRHAQQAAPVLPPSGSTRHARSATPRRWRG